MNIYYLQIRVCLTKHIKLFPLRFLYLDMNANYMYIANARYKELKSVMNVNTLVINAHL